MRPKQPTKELKPDADKEPDRSPQPNRDPELIKAAVEVLKSANPTTGDALGVAAAGYLQRLFDADKPPEPTKPEAGASS